MVDAEAVHREKDEDLAGGMEWLILDEHGAKT